MFTYNIQLAGYDFSQADEKGEISFNNFSNILETFPWMQQLEKSNSIQKGASATISVINDSDGNVLWISIAGDTLNHTYLVGYVFSKTSKTFLGIGKEKTKRWVDIYSIKDLSIAKEYFNLFFCSNYTELKRNLSFEEKFDSLEAKK